MSKPIKHFRDPPAEKPEAPGLGVPDSDSSPFPFIDPDLPDVDGLPWMVGAVNFTAAGAVSISVTVNPSSLAGSMNNLKVQGAASNSISNSPLQAASLAGSTVTATQLPAHVPGQPYSVRVHYSINGVPDFMTGTASAPNVTAAVAAQTAALILLH